MEDVKAGMTVPGIVTNITNFGVFVDIGVKQDGLVHISQLSNTFISDPNQVVKLQQKVTVTITEVDVARKRISLTMKRAGRVPITDRFRIKKCLQEMPAEKKEPMNPEKRKLEKKSRT